MTEHRCKGIRNSEDVKYDTNIDNICVEKYNKYIIFGAEVLMEKKISKVTIKGILIFALSFIIAEVIVIAMAGVFAMRKAANVGTVLYDNYGKVQGELEAGYGSFQEVKIQLRNTLFMYAEDKDAQNDAIDKIEIYRNDLHEKYKEAKKHMLDQDNKALLDETVKYTDLYLADVDICLDYVAKGKIDEAREHLRNNVVDSAIVSVEKLEECMKLLDVHAKEKQATLEKENRNGTIVIVIMLILSVVCCLSILSIMITGISNPIHKLSDIAKQIAKGEVDIDLPAMDGKNEVAVLQSSFHDMITNLKEQAKILERVAEGDLQVDIIPKTANDLMGNAIKRMLDDDNRAFSAIRNATGQISVSSGEIAAASQTLAQGSTEQASSIQEISASITDIANKTKDNASQAEEVNRILLEAKDAVVAGNQRMREMVDAMRDINESSENIQKIIKVIDDIAFNTNILALNATVEAARAGDQGKGFAVVAEEVRNLAGRSADESSQTAELIEDSIHKVKRGSQLAIETAQALEELVGVIDQATDKSEAIAAASNEQASATAQIDIALMQVSQVVQTNSATSEECAAASEELAGQANGLKEQLAKYQIKDDMGMAISQNYSYGEPLRYLESSSRY